MTFLRILVGLDRSELGQAVFTQALVLAQSCGAHLHVLHVFDLEPMAVSGLSPLTPSAPELGIYSTLVHSTPWSQHNQAHVDQIHAWLQQQCQVALNQGVPAEFSYRVGSPGGVLCEVAQHWQADLVVVGHRGRSGLVEALLGSISNHVVHHSPCSVLVV